MKYKIFKYQLYIALLALVTVSCNEGNQVVDQITEDVTRGAILRQLDVLSNSVAINSATNVLQDGENFSVLLEFQDDEDGALLERMDVFLGFDDNTDDGAENSVSEILFESIAASQFSTGDRGLPTFLYTATAQQMQSALGLDNNQIGFGGDDFVVRFEIFLTDGRSFSNDDNSGQITGSFFNSPFLTNVRVVCAPSVPTSGTWNFIATDTYGDGWNGAFLTINIDGADAGTIENLDGGPSEQAFDFEVPAGAQTISLVYTGGAFDCEVLLTVTSANGNEVVNVGPNPPTGVELLDYCLDNL